jgi:hypothetical protein
MLELVPGQFHAPDCDMGEDCACQPVYGTRAPEPGPRGCWALKADGTPCGAAARREQDYCGAHSGSTPVAQDPGKWAPIAREASAQARTRRATLRAALGIMKPDSTRGLLKATAYVERERVVAAAMAPLRDLDTRPMDAHRAALALLDAVEPQARAELSVEVPTSAEQVGALGLEELRTLVEGHAPSPPP